MRFLYLISGAVLFLLLLGFALKNTTPVELHYYLGYAWQAPLSLMLLITVVCGIVAGVIACVPVLIRQRRELLALKRELNVLKPKP